MAKITEEEREDKTAHKEIQWLSDAVLKSNYQAFQEFQIKNALAPKYRPDSLERYSYTFDIEYEYKNGSKRPFLAWIIEYNAKGVSNAYIVPFNCLEGEFRSKLSKCPFLRRMNNV